MTAVSKIIAEEIASQGPIPFSRFMHLALYCPVYGYYEAEKDRIGQKGDFITSVSTGPLFGRILAYVFAGWLKALLNAPGAPSRVQLVEAAGHDARLARDILTGLATDEPDLVQAVDYWLLEPSASRREWQRQTLASAPSVYWASHLSELNYGRQLRGVIFSNELLDAMPIRRFGWDATARQWFEWGVGFSGNAFHWHRLPVTAPRFDFPPKLAEVLPDGFILEIGDAAVEWWKTAASRLEAGLLVTLDYGHLQPLAPERAQGTLRAYHKHTVFKDVLSQPGKQDITAHVNFAAIRQAGEAVGLETLFLQSQSRFLGRAFTEMCQRNPSLLNPSTVGQFHSLTHPHHLGSAFSVLAQGRAGSPSQPSGSTLQAHSSVHN